MSSGLRFGISVFLLSLTILSSGQRRKNQQTPVLDSLPENVVLNIYDLPHINDYPEYYNVAKLNRIVQLEKEKNWEQLYTALRDYVGQFGIQNFYKDTRLIWRLAKLTELFGEREEALSLYRLVLRHHHLGIDIREIELYYDSLNQQQANQFVPLEYYYELVEHRKLIDTLRPPRGVLLNMGAQINSRKADYAPTLNYNGNLLLFTSKRNEVDLTIRRQPNEDLFVSRLDDYGYWSQAEALEQVNSRYNEGSGYLSRDGQKLYFSRCDCATCYGDCDIFEATMQPDSTWGDIQNLGINVNSLSWDSHPALSHTEDTLFFASDKLGGFGLADIYFTYRKSDSSWAPSKNLGPVINTRQNEVSPFYHPTEKLLYFTSNGQLFNFGEFDIYKSHYVNNSWSEPQNIGPLVNGRGSEFYFTIDKESQNLFYSRSNTRDLNKLDLYSFPLPMAAQPLANTALSGSLTDSITGEPFHGIVSIIDIDDGIEVAPKYLKADGTFEFELIDQRNYLLVISGDDFFRIERAFFLDGPMHLYNVTEPLAARVKFSSVEFQLGKSELTTSMYGDLNKIVNFMYDNPLFQLRISGHTDSFGAEEFNLQLSKQRAQSIRDYFVIFAGLHESRVEYEGYGSSMPLVEELTEEDKAINRRVEFEIYRPALEATPSESDF